MAELKSDRLLSLDIFRGITILGMILVNNPGSWSNIYSPLAHAKWNGCTPTDLIFPFFLFIVGVTTVFSLEKFRLNNSDLKPILIRILKRSFILFFLGMFLASFPYFDFSSVRIPGVLQRIAFVYLFTSIIFLNVKKDNIKYVLVLIILSYWAIMAWIPNPINGEAGFEAGKNISAWIDKVLLGNHLWKAMNGNDPEGILSTLPAIGTALLGVLTGYQLKNEKDKKLNTIYLFFYGSVLMGIGYAMDFWIPINKTLWTSSYVVYTGGLALVFLGICYWLIDVQNIRWWIKPFHIYGTNAITVFFLSSFTAKSLYLIKVSNEAGESISLKYFIYSNIFLPIADPKVASFMYAMCYILFWLFITWLFYRKKIFIKV